ncbi:MAG TPA: PilZ domain-containing protein [Polyangiaceae bacterium]
MTPADELAELDAHWDDLNASSSNGALAPSSSLSPVSHGTFGHEHERRLGLRVPAACWALLKDGDHSVYARTVEISPTGAVLKLLDGSETRFDRARRYELDIFVPGASRPVHAVARPARAIGQLEAFEFSKMSSDDRLTLAEHLDHLVDERPNSEAPPASARPVAPPVSWKNFVLSLKRSKSSSPVVAQRF